jgi:hypothetical protein
MKESMDSKWSLFRFFNEVSLMMALAVVKRIDEDPAFGPPLLKPSRLRLLLIELL